MIRRDQIERTAAQTGPEGLPVSRLADRQRAFELGRSGRYVVGRKRQIVRTFPP